MAKGRNRDGCNVRPYDFVRKLNRRLLRAHRVFAGEVRWRTAAVLAAPYVEGMQTILNLLTRDGTLYMAFSPALTAEQYSRVVWLVKTVPTRAEMRKLIQSWARVQGQQLSFD